MADVEVPAVAATPPFINVADRLAKHAQHASERIAVVCRKRNSSRDATINFGQLDADASMIARGLVDWGITPGMRLALLVRPGIEFVTLVFALLRAGAVMVLVDPGLGRKNLVRCLAETEPEGFVAIPPAQAVRTLLRHKFPRAKWNVTVGRRWFWGGPTLDDIRQRGEAAYSVRLQETRADAPAAIIFTSGSTGPPKGVLYTQRMFETQVAEIQSMYGIEPGGIDLSCFPLFALFNSAMGVTTVFPDMNFSRPASASPLKLYQLANEWKVTQAFASPAVWTSLTSYVGEFQLPIYSLKNVFSCGAPVSADLLGSILSSAGAYSKVHTPYGATECLPVATIEAAEVRAETADKTADGAGVCVGRKFNSIEWRIIRITDEPIAEIAQTELLATGEIGELIVRGPQASPRYVTRTECNANAKIADVSGQWHRMGDVGYLDDTGRFWYCGRKSQRVETTSGSLFTECIEAIFNSHPAVYRSALVGIGPQGRQKPVVICQPKSEITYCGGRPVSKHNDHRLVRELRELAQQHLLTQSIDRFVLRNHLPVDIRHNAKINREQLAKWVAARFPELA